MKEQINKLTRNPIGLIAGGLAGWLLAKKVLKIESNLWSIVGAGAGAVIGANAQERYKAKKSQPTAQLINK
jgi:outer membrane lipoprotein SlyB